MALTTEEKYSIVQIIDRLNVGGAERVLVTLSNLLHQKGHKVTVVTTVNKGPLASMLNKDIAVIELKRKWKWNPVTMFRLIKSIKNFDIIHVHSRHNLRYLFLAKTICGYKKKVFYHEHHGYRVNTKATSFEKNMFQSVFFIAVSEKLRAWSISAAHVDPKNTFKLANTVIQETFLKNRETDSNTYNLVVTSNFVPVKNIEFAITVLESLQKKENKKYTLTIIGSIHDKEYYNKINLLIQNKNLNGQINFITDCNNVQALLHKFDLALHTATSESGPLVLIEYIAQGLPFITYQTGEVAEQIKNDVPEFIMENFDVEEWVDRVVQLLQKDRSLLQQQMQVIFDKYYSADVYYEKCMAIYKSGLAKQKSTG